MGLFNRNREGGSAGSSAGGVVRPSRGWAATLEFLKQREGLRVLDFGPTSSSNINFLTNLGHSFYMADLVEDAAKPEWWKPAEGKAPAEFDVEKFVAENLNFSGKEFDVVLLWDTADYLPASLVPVMFARIKDVLRPEGRVLAFSHGKAEGPETVFSRYQLKDSGDVLVVPVGQYPVKAVYQTRQLEKFLEGYADVRFFLGKDNTREVSAVR